MTWVVFCSTLKEELIINVPNTLSIVDASVGGKTGIDFQFLKNQIGTFMNQKWLL